METFNFEIVKKSDIASEEGESPVTLTGEGNQVHRELSQVTIYQSSWVISSCRK